MQLTTNFNLTEFTRSDTATKMGIENIPDSQQIDKLKTLCKKVLQPLREIYAEPFIINSGFRSTQLNKAVGGAPTSQHQFGEAADVRVPDPTQLLCDLLSSGIEFDQAILYPTFLHISYREGKNRKQVLYSKDAKK